MGVELVYGTCTECHLPPDAPLRGGGLRGLRAAEIPNCGRLSLELLVVPCFCVGVCVSMMWLPQPYPVCGVCLVIYVVSSRRGFVGVQCCLRHTVPTVGQTTNAIAPLAVAFRSLPTQQLTAGWLTLFGSNPRPTQVLLEVGARGFRLLRTSSEEPLFDFPFAQIHSWGHLPNRFSFKFYEEKSKSVVLYTFDCKLVDPLLKVCAGVLLEANDVTCLSRARYESTQTVPVGLGTECRDRFRDHLSCVQAA